ncbi:MULTISPECIES: bi-domain-containing oxidoreductase [unclassified Acinetobacter]|uniref:bi-domain-containing oxidoreductase n=1 Tax=unclassified Acinetobacter TaxID=196816 RepID=UPI0025C673A1|nr:MULTISPECIES: bi-domain-containing oxidoreductase [unclassified Acinetobacter]
MKQIFQDLSKGGTSIVEAPSPQVSTGHLIISTSISLISAGTERMLVDFGKANVIDKARQQPEKVRMVLDKVKTDGLLTTYEAVQSKLNQPLPLGYCNVGIIQEVGKQVEGFKIGDRVVSNGHHADVVKVPKNLCAKIPDNVSDEAASFTVLGAIALQGIRLAQPTLGESFVVIGAGLIGLMAIQLLKANGCRVLAVDFDQKKLELAKKYGAEICNPALGQDPVTVAEVFARGLGVDGVIITASTKSNDPVHQAALMCRQRGRIILVGVVGLELNRADFYEKELSFQVSCSYGPGRYDEFYEAKGNDYPIGFVRWTEQRNFVAVLDMMASGALDVETLVSHRFKFEDAVAAYEVLTNVRDSLGIVLQYEHQVENRHFKRLDLPNYQFNSVAKVTLGCIGAGNYASRVLIPAFKKTNVNLHTIVTASGVNSVIHGEKAGFKIASSELNDIWQNSEINTCIIATRHNTHAKFVLDALNANKNVFVEKPLALNLADVDAIEDFYRSNSSTAKPHLMVGFNRRFSPQIQKMKQLLATVKQPKTFIMTMNAGAIPVDHWTQDPEIGGGRIIGEACHFIDLMRFLAGSKIVNYQVQGMGAQFDHDLVEDKACITLAFEDGSFGTIFYLANGSNAFPKERIEVFTSGKVLQLDNFRKMTGYGWSGFKKMNLWSQDKGQENCTKAFVEAIEKGESTPIPLDEILEVARVTIQAAQLLREKQA